VDHRNETLKKKIREAQVNYIPLILTIGEKEKDTGTLSVRTLDGTVKLGLSPADLVTPVQRHIKERILDDIVL
jgi:threonyl-tRNA synthetase